MTTDMAADFETKRLTFREIDLSDTEEIVAWRSEPSVYRYFKQPRRLTAEEHIRWYRERYLHDPSRCDFMCLEKSSGRKAGVFGLIRDGADAEVNYLIAPEARRKGYASEGVAGLCGLAAGYWHVERIIATVHRDNTASLRLAERLGFRQTDVRGDFVVCTKTLQ